MRLSLPGTYGQQVLDALQIAACDLDNYISGGAGLNAHEQLERYAEWAMESALRLEAFLSTDAIARLVLTRTYHTIVAAGPTASERSLNSLLHIETSARRRHLRLEMDHLGEQVAKWASGPDLVVFDTNVFLHHQEELRLLDFAKLLGHRKPIRLLVPMVIVDELDNAKRGKDGTRDRARRALRTLTDALTEGEFSGLLPRPDGSSAVTVEIVREPAGHERLPLPDDEIIDQTMTVYRIGGRAVSLVTYDTGMQMRARGTGVIVVKLDHEDVVKET